MGGVGPGGQSVFFPGGGRGGFRPFTRLSPEARVRYLDSWRTSSWAPRRLVFTSLRAIVTALAE